MIQDHFIQNIAAVSVISEGCKISACETSCEPAESCSVTACDEPQTVNWHGKPYYSLDAFCKNTYGEKLYKVSLDAGLTCPNRDGRIGTGGCIFCSAGGSGDFASPIKDADSFSHSFQESIQRLDGKHTGQKYIAYFQAYTNTYGPISYLEKIYHMALAEPLSAGISIATRPDCLPDEVLNLLARLKTEFPEKFIWVELGLQTIHESTAVWIRRGYPLSCFSDAVKKLHSLNIPVIVHVILGLPGETREDMTETIAYLNRQPIMGIKLQMLHILKNTDLGTLYEHSPSSCGGFHSREDYLNVLIDCLTSLRPDIVIHRLTGDAPRKLLLFPMWSTDKRQILNLLHMEMKKRHAFQGQFYHAPG